MEQTIRGIRRRLPAHAAPATRYRLRGAAALRAELQARGLRPRPHPRTIERVPQRHGLTAPRVRRAPRRPRQEYPGPPARAANDLPEVGCVGPVYLPGSGRRSSLGVGKDAFDGAACLRRAGSRRRDEVLGFLGACGKERGLPEQVPSDNARERAGAGPAARAPARVIRLCRRFGAGPVFLPKGEPPCHGSAENFNGWFPEPLFQQR